MMKSTVLVVEDDDNLREVISETLRLAGYDIVSSCNGDDGLEVLQQRKDISLVLSDVQMQPVDGYTLLRGVRKLSAEMPVVLMTAYGTIANAVEAMRIGANDYLVKPFEADDLITTVKRHIRVEDTDADTVDTQAHGMLAVDDRSRQMMEVAKRVAASQVTVMLSGESGVGKEVVSRYIHHYSSRSQGPFVAINCAAIPENMLESVLFGYEKGAFTGAHQSKAGKFEQAQNGTLLLDEITEMDLALQAKLLRVLQEKEVERIGGRKVIPLDVRILATTNRDIRKEVAQGRFREDLFYRLNVFPLYLLALRDRPDDIIPLAKLMLDKYSAGAQVPTLTPSAVSALSRHSWPGNVRELDNVIQRALILADGDEIDVSDIRFEQDLQAASLESAEPGNANPEPSVENDTTRKLSKDLKAHEKELIISALQARTSRKEVAAKLGISPRTLRYKLAKMRDAGIAIPA